MGPSESPKFLMLRPRDVSWDTCCLTQWLCSSVPCHEDWGSTSLTSAALGLWHRIPPPVRKSSTLGGGAVESRCLGCSLLIRLNRDVAFHSCLFVCFYYVGTISMKLKIQILPKGTKYTAVSPTRPILFPVKSNFQRFSFGFLGWSRLHLQLCGYTVRGGH